MAVWEYNIYLLERNYFDETYGNITYFPSILDEEELWKSDNDLYQEVNSYLSSTFPKFEGWTKDIGFWGIKDKSTLTVNFENNDIVDIHVRLDLRDKNFIEFLEKVIEFVEKYKLIMFDLKGEILEPKIGNIIYSIKDSNAWKFVLNPYEYLGNYSKLLKNNEK